MPERYSCAANGYGHITASGIPPIAQAGGDDADLAFRPWPGESVELTIERPKAIEGQTLTIDTSVLDVAPGNRATDYRLQFTARSSPTRWPSAPSTVRLPTSGIRPAQFEKRMKRKTLAKNQNVRRVRCAPMIPSSVS